MIKNKRAELEVSADDNLISELASNEIKGNTSIGEEVSEEVGLEKDEAINQNTAPTNFDELTNSFEEDLANISNQPEEVSSNLEDKINAYTGIINDLQDEIIKLNAEIDFTNKELYSLKAKSQIWENPFSIYNKEIILNNGSTIYGKITYQDKRILKIETLIGSLTIDRKTIVRIIENVPHSQDTNRTEDTNFSTIDIIEIKKDLLRELAERRKEEEANKRTKIRNASARTSKVVLRFVFQN